MNGIDVKALISEYPVVEKLAAGEECLWLNAAQKTVGRMHEDCALTMADILDAQQLLERFAPYIRKVFPETAENNGIIESGLLEIPATKQELERRCGVKIDGRLLLKPDSHLPVSGSVKARGGIYEVLKTAEDIAGAEGLIKGGESHECFDTEEFRKTFSIYSIAVGSTGNLGLSIGIMSARLGFDVSVHMSADARQWKKDLLRQKGAKVIEYASDYSIAVKKGREEAAQNPKCHFVDDENSQTLFLGYATAALRLKKQLEERCIAVDGEHPLFVYLPCGVGGAPGGIAFGLRKVFGDSVHCFFAEPTQSCCMTLGLATGLNSKISVRDIGLDNATVADGLAVGRASGFVGEAVGSQLSGCYTLRDERMQALMSLLADADGIFLEPSALAGLYGPIACKEYAAAIPQAENITHLVWATGGSMVPEKEMREFYTQGKQLEAKVFG